MVIPIKKAKSQTYKPWIGNWQVLKLKSYSESSRNARLPCIISKLHWHVSVCQNITQLCIDHCVSINLLRPYTKINVNKQLKPAYLPILTEWSLQILTVSKGLLGKIVPDGHIGSPRAILVLAHPVAV